jgi:dienelactone hydrolase
VNCFSRIRITLALFSILSLLSACGGSDDSAGSVSGQPTAAETVKPGPSLLYKTAAVSPQLESVGIWKAPPIMVSGASAYRSGEFLYQDFLYDDRGSSNTQILSDLSVVLGGGSYTYPTHPSYASNAADIVEVRIKPTSDSTAFRITMNSMLDASKVGISIGIGDKGIAYPFPHGANTKARASVFVTVHGNTGDIVDAATGVLLGAAPVVSVDSQRRQIEVRVPFSVLDTRGQQQVRVTIAAGLWDSAAGKYLLPKSTADAANPGGAGALVNPSAFFNVAFRFAEPLDTLSVYGKLGSPYNEFGQATTLFSGDISAFSAQVDFIKLASGLDDDMAGQFGGVPQTGYIKRIFVSNFESAQGRGGAATSLKPADCTTPCVPTFAGRLQPYTVYVPDVEPAAGFGLTLNLHGAGSSYNGYSGSMRHVQFARAGNLVLTSGARGTTYWYYGQALADVFEAWADVARNYKVDTTKVKIAGTSMGGYGALKIASLWPDLFAAAAPFIPCPSAGTGYNGTNLPGGTDSFVFPLVDSLRHVPTMVWTGESDPVCNGSGSMGSEAAIAKMASLGYRVSEWVFKGMAHTVLPDYQGQAAFLDAQGPLNPNPARVTYVLNTTMVSPELGIDAGHAYWVSGLTLRDNAATYLGSIDVFSRGFGTVDPTLAAPVTTTDVYDCGTACTSVPTPGNATTYQVVKTLRNWNTPAATTVGNQLDITATNIAHVTIDVARAKVDCNVTLNIHSDGPVTVSLAGCPSRTNEQH